MRERKETMDAGDELLRQIADLRTFICQQITKERESLEQKLEARFCKLETRLRQLICLTSFDDDRILVSSC